MDDGGARHAEGPEDLIDGDAAEAERGEEAKFGPGQDGGTFASFHPIDGDDEQARDHGPKANDQIGRDFPKDHFGRDVIAAPDEQHQHDEVVDNTRCFGRLWVQPIVSVRVVSVRIVT